MTAPAQPTPFPRLTYNAKGHTFTLDREDPEVRVDCTITPSYFSGTLAAEIAKRWNAHAEFVAFVERIATATACLEAFGYNHAPRECIGCDARALLAKIRGAR